MSSPSEILDSEKVIENPIDPSQPGKGSLTDQLLSEADEVVEAAPIVAKARWAGATKDAIPAFGGVPSISQGKDEPSLIQRGLNALGNLLGQDNLTSLSEGAKAQALVMHLANEEGVPLHEYRQAPELLEQLSAGLMDGYSLGLIPALRTALTGEIDYPATSAAGQIAQGAGELVGMARGPFRWASALIGPKVLLGLGATTKMPLGTRILKEGFKDALTVGLATTMGATGEALSEENFTKAGRKYWDALKSGATVGTLFGMTRGVFPKGDWGQRAARLVTGLVGMNAYRAYEMQGNPFYDRPLHMVVFDTLLDGWFLWKGLPNKSRAEILRDIEDFNKFVDDNGLRGGPNEPVGPLAPAGEVPADAAQSAQVKVKEVAKKRADQMLADIEAKINTAVESKVATAEQSAKVLEEKGAADLAKGFREKASEMRKKGYEAGGTGEVLDSEKVVEPDAPPTESTPPPAQPSYYVSSENAAKLTSLMEAKGDKAELRVHKSGKLGLVRVGGKNDGKFYKGSLVDFSTEAAEGMVALGGKPSEVVPEKVIPETTTVNPPETNQNLNRLGGSSRVSGIISTPTSPVPKNGYSATVAKYAAELGVPEDLVNAVIQVESGGNPGAVSPKGAQGLMQLMPKTAKELGVKDPSDPTQNIIGGIKYLRQLLNRYNGDEIKALQAYNAGMRKVDKGKIPKETREYVERVKARLARDFGVGEVEKLPITPIDEVTGVVETPVKRSPTGGVLSKTDSSPFRNTDVATVNARQKAMNVKGTVRSPESLTQYLVNEVNRWLNGDETVDLKGVQSSLSRLAARGKELSGAFDTEQEHYDWMNMAREAAKWARDAKRSEDGLKNESTVGDRAGEKPGSQLNMMIPLDQIPKAVKDLIQGSKYLFDMFTKHVKSMGKDSELFRNKEIYNKTGFWISREGKWRYELDPDSVKNQYRNFSEEELNAGMDLDRLIDAPELFEKFPEARKVKIVQDRTLGDLGASKTDLSEIAIQDMSDTRTIHHEINHLVNGLAGSKFIGTSPEAEVYNRVIQIFNELRSTTKQPELIKTIDSIVKDMNQGKTFYAYEIADKLYSTVDSRDRVTRRLVKQASREIGNLDGFPSYIKDPGEMESRLSTYRLEMSPEERRKEPPWESLDKMLAEEAEKYDMPSIRQAGFKLYSNAPLDEAAKLVVNIAKGFSNYTKKARGMKEFKPLEAMERARKTIIRTVLDREGNIDAALLKEENIGRQGYETVKKASLAAGGSTKAADMLSQMRDEVYVDLTRDEKRVLDNLILAARMLDIGSYKSNFVFPKEIEPTAAAAYNELFRFIEGLTPERADLLKKRANDYFEWMKIPLKDMLDEGLITQKEYDDMVRHKYRRLKLVDIVDKRYGDKPRKSTRTVFDSGVEALQRGKETDIFEPSSEIMALEVFNRAYGRIYNNRANRELLELTRMDPTNPFVRARKSELPEAIRNKAENTPKGWSRIFVYENGKRKALMISPGMAKEWITRSPEMTYELSQFLRIASASPILRTFATGIDLAFALKNIFRDVQRAGVVSRWYTQDGTFQPVYSSILPVYMGEMVKDLSDVFYDAVHRTGRYKDAVDEGGGMEMLSHQRRLLQRGRHIGGPVDDVLNKLGWAGATTEIMVRLAIRERVIKRRAKELGITVEEARKIRSVREDGTFSARDYLDFHKGGSLTKAFDNAVPYMNVTVQGTKGIFRAMKEHPMIFAAKVIQFGALVGGLYLYNREKNPETMKALRGDTSMRNNICFPMGDEFGFIDNEGMQRYMFLKLPLDQGQRFFKTFFEGVAAQHMGDEVDIPTLVETLQQMSPTEALSLPPTVMGALGYLYNKDFYFNKPIFEGTKEANDWEVPKWITGGLGGSENEFDEIKTPKAFVDFGALTGLSPMRSEYAASQVVPASSMYVQAGKYLYDKAFRDFPQDQREEHIAMMLSKFPIVSSFFGVTNPYTQHAKMIKDTNAEIELKHFVENKKLQAIVVGYLKKGTGSREDARAYIAQFKDPATQDRLLKQWDYAETVRDVQELSFWMSMKGAHSAEARAKMWDYRMTHAGAAEQERLRSDAAIIDAAGGVFSKEFWDKYDEIQEARR